MQFISWNIDGLTNALDNTTLTWQTLQQIAQQQPDILAIQETQLTTADLPDKQKHILEILFPNYQIYSRHCTAKANYSGTLILSKQKPLNITYPVIDAPTPLDEEGRIITLEFDAYFISTVYTPNSRHALTRLPDRLAWNISYRTYIKSLDIKKPVIFSGDFNVAHKAIDLASPQANHRHPRFTDEERTQFSSLLAEGFIDTFRYIHPNSPDAYTWWDPRIPTSKITNNGWRIDYYLLSHRLADNIQQATIMDSGIRQDHAPIMLQLEL